MMIRKYSLGDKLEAPSLQSGKKLLGPRNPAKCRDRAISLRNSHTAPDPPNRAPPTPLPQLLFEPVIVRRNRQHARPRRSLDWLTQITGGQQLVAPVFAIDKQHIDITKELSMLKAIIEEMHQRDRIPGHLSSVLDESMICCRPGLVPLRCHP